MKKILSSVLVCVLLLSSILVLASCSKTISGTYEAIFGSEAMGYKVTYAFDGREVEVSRQLVSAIGSTNPTVVNGTYEIKENEEGQKTITFNFGGAETEEDVAEEGIALDFAEGNEDGVKYIKIGNVRYDLVD